MTSRRRPTIRWGRRMDLRSKPYGLQRNRQYLVEIGEREIRSRARTIRIRLTAQIRTHLTR